MRPIFDRVVMATDLSPTWDQIVACGGELRSLGCVRRHLDLRHHPEFLWRPRRESAAPHRLPPGRPAAGPFGPGPRGDYRDPHRSAGALPEWGGPEIRRLPDHHRLPRQIPVAGRSAGDLFRRGPAQYPVPPPAPAGAWWLRARSPAAPGTAPSSCLTCCSRRIFPRPRPKPCVTWSYWRPGG